MGVGEIYYMKQLASLILGVLLILIMRDQKMNSLRSVAQPVIVQLAFMYFLIIPET